MIKHLGRQDYHTVLADMQAYTATRDQSSSDQIWLLEHPPVFTQGYAGKAEHVLNTGDIPLVQTDRGGQVTYHGPGQLIAYCLFDLKRHRLGAKDFVYKVEQAVIDCLSNCGISGVVRRDGAPGLFIDDKKI